MKLCGSVGKQNNGEEGRLRFSQWVLNQHTKEYKQWNHEIVESSTQTPRSARAAAIIAVAIKLLLISNDAPPLPGLK